MHHKIDKIPLVLCFLVYQNHSRKVFPHIIPVFSDPYEPQLLTPNFGLHTKTNKISPTTSSFVQRSHYFNSSIKISIPIIHFLIIVRLQVLNSLGVKTVQFPFTISITATLFSYSDKYKLHLATSSSLIIEAVFSAFSSVFPRLTPYIFSSMSQIARRSVKYSWEIFISWDCFKILLLCHIFTYVQCMLVLILLVP